VFTAATVVVGFAVRLPQTETSRLPFTVGQMTPDPMVVQMSLVDVWPGWLRPAGLSLLSMLYDTYERAGTRVR